MAELGPGTVLGERFEVIGVLGVGGMATVYLCADRLRGEQIALKVLHSHLARSASMRSRLRREVQTAGQLRSPAALVAWDLHEVDGYLALSLPLHRGTTLSEHVHAHGPLSAEALERLATQLGSALTEAHHLGIVHRDVTPSNILVDADGNAVLTDFGLARSSTQQTATMTAALGTTGYAAPEVYQGVRTDPRSDIYSLGAVLYLAATGRAPFDAPDPMGVLRRQLDEDWERLEAARPDLPDPLTRTVQAMLDIDPDQRPQDASAIEDMLAGHLETAVADVAAVDPMLVERARLPRGTWSVVVREPARQAPRRAGLRALRNLPDGRPTYEDVRHLLSGIGRSAEGEESPEALLAMAVEHEADLPQGCLAVPPAMLHEEFRLVKDVDEGTARRLEVGAVKVGFDAGSVDMADARRVPSVPAGAVVAIATAMGFSLTLATIPLYGTLVGVLEVLPPLIRLPISPLRAEQLNTLLLFGATVMAASLPLVGAMATATWTSRRSIPAEESPEGPAAPERVAPVSWAAAVVGALLAGLPGVAMVVGGLGLVMDAPFFVLPIQPLAATVLNTLGVMGLAVLCMVFVAAGGLAAHRAVRRHGQRRSLARLPAAYTPDLTVSLRAVARTHTASEARSIALAHRVKDHLAALAAAVDGARDRLPDVAIRELHDTVRSLRTKVDRLAEAGRQIDDELGRLDEAGAAQAVDRLETRVERMHTLARAGQDDPELPAVERALAAHRATLEEADALEGKLTRVTAQLLEIRAAAARARRDLIDDPGDDGARALLAQLGVQASSAVHATAEVGARLPREAPASEAVAAGARANKETS